MKEPKYQKLENMPKDNKYDFFAEGIFPEEIEEKKRLNKNRSSKKQNPFPFTIPLQQKKAPNTQKEDDDLVPFFAKNYPQSSESEQDICFINSPVPSDTPDNSGEAEEVEVEEEESDEFDEKVVKKNKEKKQNNNNINNDEIGASVEYNSELEYEYEHPSRMLSREEVQELMRKNQERKREEQRKKEEEEKRKKEEEENKKKEEEAKKQKEKEDKDKKEKEKLKKQEEDKKKKMKSSKKDPITGLSSIKKNYDDNSNMASNSMINDMQNMFEIPEEKGENDEDEDDTKKNFKNNSKEKYSSKKSKNNSKSKKSKNLNDFDENIEKNKSKKNPKSTTEEDEETKETDNNNKKSKKNSRKSNGIKKEDKKEEEKIIPEDSKEEDEENFSNYGDQLADNDTSPKKEKIKPKKKNRSKKGKPVEKYKDISDFKYNTPEIYNLLQNVETVNFKIDHNNEIKEFGETRKYSLRQRLPKLNHSLGEKAEYIYDKDGNPTLVGVTKVRTHLLSQGFNETLEKIKKKKNKQKKGKKLKKGVTEKIEEIKEEEDENSDSLVSDDISEGGDDNARILKIPKGGKKSRAKNYDTVLTIKIIEANGKNVIKVNEKKYKNMKSDDEVKVDKNQEYEVLNFSDNPLIIQLLFEDMK